MGVAVLIPWRAGCPHREQALNWVTTRLNAAHPAWDVVLGEHTAGDWCKARAVDAAISQTDADILIVHDADVYTSNLVETVEACVTWVIPHRKVYRLDEHATAHLYATGMPGAGLTRNPYVGYAGGGIVVIRRDIYESCPLDPGFVNWGQEDASWALALTCLHGQPWRGDADLLHLWHPPQPRISRTTGSAEGQALHRRYQDAAHSRSRMQRLLAEVRGHVGEAPQDQAEQLHRTRTPA